MITAERMAQVDVNAEALGVPRKQLMESSGNAVARAVREESNRGDRVVLVCGRGNNGGDAFAAARFLDGREVSVFLLGRPENISTEIARENWRALEAAGYETTELRDSTWIDGFEGDVVVDAILGTGVRGAPREPERTAIEAMNAADAPVVSVDVPSGLDADAGEAADVVADADRVVTFHDTKPGLADLDCPVTVADIGIPDAAQLYVERGDLLALGRDPSSHKGENGELLVVGGGPYTGAPALAAQAALRGGTDLVRVAAPESVAREVQGYSEALIVEALTGERLRPGHVDDLLGIAAQQDAVVLGPGLGDADETMAAVREFLSSYGGRAVVDADALAVVPEVDTDADLVCTPHRGELRAMGGPAVEDHHDRDIIAEFAADLGHTLAVKGVFDVVTDGADTRVNRTGNPGMTVGGTGDVLAGVTGALVAGLDPLQAAAIGAYANGRAGDLAVEDVGGYGLSPTDLLDRLPAALWGDHA